ncbi:MAG: hypothetical protein Q9163_002152 [Psora crenata]
MKLYLSDRESRLVASGRRPTRWDRTVSWTGTVGAAGLAKFFAALVTYPHEVIRTRLRQAPQSNGRMKYTGIVHCFRAIWREEGMVSLYGGLTPHMLRVVPSAAIMFGIPYKGNPLRMASSAHSTNEHTQSEAPDSAGDARNIDNDPATQGDALVVGPVLSGPDWLYDDGLPLPGFQSLFEDVDEPIFETVRLFDNDGVPPSGFEELYGEELSAVEDVLPAEGEGLYGDDNDQLQPEARHWTKMTVKWDSSQQQMTPKMMNYSNGGDGTSTA